MRTYGVSPGLLVVVVVVLLMEGVNARPTAASGAGRSKRNGQICSSRDILEMANRVCDLYRRSAGFNVPLPTVWPLLHQDSQDKMTRGGYGYDTEARVSKGATFHTAIHNPGRGGRGDVRGSVHTNTFLPVVADSRTRLLPLGPQVSNHDLRDGVENERKFMVRTNLLIKRNPSEPSTHRTLEELRVVCCTRGCTVNDFLGACS
ncbi:hypothetical protein Pcinc_026185 [Petrolisthes cinctipes]|uniref:Uncharacterized protein n=1 Tax=Petrolisthes cinctipes TaxID=88211 RepID=A0AAE1KAH0_PETCI|nr:hypothetical protein Pcinc_026185 [Petrolisthes cinctipes]